MISEWIGSDRVGSVIEGRFHLQRWLGGAEESGVFLTEIGGESRRNAAIKIIPAGIADAESLLDEWIKAKRRIHPHIIQLFHAGYCRMDDCDLLYAVTDRADEILADVLPVRPLTPAEVRELLDSLLETLTWLHGQGLAHGSLKPSNVMVVNEQIRLSVDRIQPAGPRVFPVLSPGIYEAPESAVKVSPAADIWSLGVLLVEALTQKPPFWHGTGPRIPASVPQPFASIASECLRLDPARRCTFREIRSHLAPAPRAVAPSAAAPRAPVVEGVRSPVVVAPPAPVPKASVPAEAPPVASAPVAPAQPPADCSSSPSLSPSPIPNLVSPPLVAEPAPPHVASTVAPALEAALPIVVPAIAEELPAITAPEAPAEGTIEQLEVAPEQSAITPEQPAPQTPDERPNDSPAQHANPQLPAAAALRRTNNPAAAPVQTVQKPRANRLATVIASAMVVIAAGLMLAIALHVSSRSSSPAASSSATSRQPVPARPAPLPQAPVSPPSAPQSSSPAASAPPASATPAPVTPSSSNPSLNAPASPPPPTGASVSSGPTTSGAVVHRVLPHVTQRALDTIGGRLVVIVRVQVDANGNVSDASFDYEGSSHYLKTAALAAAPNWKFRPAQIGGRPVPSTWDLQFWFDQSGPSVVPIEKTP
ncbi:MAG: TonB family protein [Terracidiphilus sp.]